MPVETLARPTRKVEKLIPVGKRAVPGVVHEIDLSLLGSGMRTGDKMPALARSNPECHNTRAQSCATCPLVNCSLKECSNPCN